VRSLPSSASPPSPFGVAWFILYGYLGGPAAPYLPALRSLGARSTKIYLFWQQIEPEKGRFDWSAVDAFASQLNDPDEGLISIFSSSLWATRIASAMLPPSPAKNLDDYYRLVFETVRRCAGRVRYWQNDAEPNNPVFWSGTKEAYVDQLKVFHRAVKDADPNAIVIVGGHDGLFVPPSMLPAPGTLPAPGQRTTPFPHQEVGLAFFDYIFAHGSESFDIFDLRLYGDPYTIEARIAYMRERMRAHGFERPIVCTEYGGPNLFEFPENRKYVTLVQSWSQAATQPDAQGMPAPNAPGPHPVAQLYAEMSSLPPQTQMFMLGCRRELESKYQRLQARSLVMRNVIGVCAGVQRLLYWDLLSAKGPRDDLMTLMYAKIGLLELEGGEVKGRTVTADAFQRMTEQLSGVQSIRRVPTPGSPTIQLFTVDRGAREQTYVVWDRRDAFSGEDAPPTTFSFEPGFTSANALDALGNSIDLHWDGTAVRLPVSVTPIYLIPKPVRQGL
jgi:hypothetical protein